MIFVFLPYNPSFSGLLNQLSVMYLLSNLWFSSFCFWNKFLLLKNTLKATQVMFQKEAEPNACM